MSIEAQLRETENQMREAQEKKENLSLLRTIASEVKKLITIGHVKSNELELQDVFYDDIENFISIHKNEKGDSISLDNIKALMEEYENTHQNSSNDKRQGKTTKKTKTELEKIEAKQQQLLVREKLKTLLGFNPTNRIKNAGFLKALSTIFYANAQKVSNNEQSTVIELFGQAEKLVTTSLEYLNILEQIGDILKDATILPLVKPSISEALTKKESKLKLKQNLNNNLDDYVTESSEVNETARGDTQLEIQDYLNSINSDEEEGEEEEYELQLSSPSSFEPEEEENNFLIEPPPTLLTMQPISVEPVKNNVDDEIELELGSSWEEEENENLVNQYS